MDFITVKYIMMRHYGDVDDIYYSYFKRIHGKSIENKYGLFKYIHDGNSILDHHGREKIINTIEKYQKCLFAFSKFKHLFKMKYKYFNFDYECDMNGEQLKNYKSDRIIKVIQNKTIYTFAINDLIKIIHNSITHVENFVLYNKRPQNPFTNVEFSDCDLYNIYMKIIQSGIKLQTHILCYFNVGFNLELFNDRYVVYGIKDYVKDFVYNGTNEEVYNELEWMFNSYSVAGGVMMPYNRVTNEYINYIRPICKRALTYFILMRNVDNEVYERLFKKELKRINKKYNYTLTDSYKFRKHRGKPYYINSKVFGHYSYKLKYDIRENEIGNFGTNPFILPLC